MIFFGLLLAGVSAYVGWRAADKLAKEPPAARALALEEHALVLRSEPSGDAGEEGATEAAAPALTEEEVDRGLMLSAGSLVLASLGSLVYAPFRLLSGAVTLYVALPLFKDAYRAIVKERRPRAAILDSIATLGTLATGYYVASALGSLLYYTGRKVLRKTEDLSRQTLSNVFGELPRTVWLVKDGVEISIPFESLHAGDLVAVSAGQVVPADGVIHQGRVTLDQHALTGESQFVDKGQGDAVLAATLVLAGRALIRVERAGSATLVAELGAILNKTADYRARLDTRGERMADQSVLPFLGVSGLALVGIGPEGAAAVLSSSFNEGLRIGVPLGMLRILQRAASTQILIKDGRALDLLHGVDTVVFDKTGTLTLEQPSIGTIYPCDGWTEESVLIHAAAAEARQTHPVARALLAAAAGRGVALPALDDAKYRLGFGMQAELRGVTIRVGSARYMAQEGIEVPAALEQRQAEAHLRGGSLVFVSLGTQLGGALELRPTVRPEAAAVVKALKARGKALCIISGDHEAPTQHLAQELGIETHFAEILPQDKAALIAKMQREGRRVCFIGDGINDAIALKQADASISLRGATAAATDTAQVVMLDDSLVQIPKLFELAAEFNDNTRTSLALYIGTTLFSLSGIFLLNFRVYAAILLYNLNLLASVGNAMRAGQKDDRPPSHPEGARALGSESLLDFGDGREHGPRRQLLEQ